MYPGTSLKTRKDEETFKCSEVGRKIMGSLSQGNNISLKGLSD